MSKTNKQRLNDMGIVNDDDIMEQALEDGLCDYCRSNIDMNLNPQNPVCEGWYCDEALEEWLEEETEADDVQSET